MLGIAMASPPKCLERSCEYSQARTHEGENQEKKQKKSMMIVIDDEVLTEDLAS